LTSVADDQGQEQVQDSRQKKRRRQPACFPYGNYHRCAVLHDSCIAAQHRWS
jgi:hypothetical protein